MVLSSQDIKRALAEKEARNRLAAEVAAEDRAARKVEADARKAADHGKFSPKARKK